MVPHPFKSPDFSHPLVITETDKSVVVVFRISAEAVSKNIVWDTEDLCRVGQVLGQGCPDVPRYEVQGGLVIIKHPYFVFKYS